MEMIEIITALRKCGLPIRVIAKATEIPKSSIHRILSKLPEIEIRPIGRDEEDGTYYYLVHLPYFFYCPDCGLEQNHAWVCGGCGMFIPVECEDEDDTCGRGQFLREMKWGNGI